jgi:hypothetical protein
VRVFIIAKSDVTHLELEIVPPHEEEAIISNNVA